MLLILLLAVLVPTGCVLWFMTAAMRNERLAVRQRLREAYLRELHEARARVGDVCKRKLSELNAAADLPPAEAFARLAGSGTADGAIIYDESGNTRCPVAPAPPGKPDEKRCHGSTSR